MGLVEDILNSGKTPGTPFRIVLTEEQLTQIANSYLGSHPGLSVSDAVVRLEPKAVTVVAKARLGVFPLRVEVVGTPVVDGGELRFDLDRMTMNGAPAPSFVASQVVEALKERLDPDNLPVDIETIVLAAGEATVAGRTK